MGLINHSGVLLRPSIGVVLEVGKYRVNLFGNSEEKKTVTKKVRVEISGGQNHVSFCPESL